MKSSTSMLISLLFAGNCLADDDPLTKQKWLKKFSGSWKAVKVQVDGEDVEKDELAHMGLVVDPKRGVSFLGAQNAEIRIFEDKNGGKGPKRFGIKYASSGLFGLYQDREEHYLKCIWKMEDDDLVICIHFDLRGDFPKEFESTEDNINRRSTPRC